MKFTKTIDQIMPIVYKRCSDNTELKEILVLQQKNLRNNLSEQEKDREGFLTVAHNFNLLREMNARCAHIIAKDGDKVVGYALCMHPDFKERIPVLIPMFRKIEEILSPTEAFVVMGQICIDKAYRKRGIFSGLYAYMQKELANEYKSIITEVDAENNRSLGAHYKVGFVDLLEHYSGGQKWHLIQWRLN